MGTTFGAFCALIFGSGMSLTGLILERTWSSHVYPWLVESGNIKYVSTVFNTVNSVFSPYVVWEMNPIKFPVNSYEIYFLAMMVGTGTYIIGSLLTYHKPYNLDRMLHRGKYNNGESKDNKSAWTWRNVYAKLIGIDDEYTKGDKNYCLERVWILGSLSVYYRVCGGTGLEYDFSVADTVVELVFFCYSNCGGGHRRRRFYGVVYGRRGDRYASIV